MLTGLFSDNENDELLYDFCEGIGVDNNKGTSCADAMEIPSLGKQKFVGLKNQGATCYLNSFYQMMFFIPEIRNMIQNLNEEFLQDKKILTAFKKLMLNMQYLDVQNQDTYFMSEAFGWKNSEMLNQHDIQEAMRIIFDQFEKELENTEYIDVFNQLMRGENQNFIECQNCKERSIRIEEFFDIFINIKMFDGQQYLNLEEALHNNFQNELLEDDNKYFCENCNTKHNAIKGQQISKLPIYTCLYLNRFEFDYNTLQRKKIIGSFSFPEQINFQDYLANQEDNSVYQLHGVIVHRGSPYSGHYYMMAKDIENLAKETNGINFFELNDTLVSKVSEDHYKKFYGGKTSGYLLFYRKLNFDQMIETNNLQLQNDSMYLQILQQNQKLNLERQNFQQMKNCIQISFISFQKLIDSNIIDRQNVQEVLSDKIDDLDEHKIIIDTSIENNMEDFINQKVQIDINKYQFYQIQFYQPNKLYYIKKIDLNNVQELKHNNKIVYIDQQDKVLNNDFFTNFQDESLPIYLSNNDNKILINSKISTQKLLQKVNQIQKVQANNNNLYLNLNGDFVNLEAILKFKKLEEVLVTDIEFIVKENDDDEYYNIAILNNYDLRQIQIQKDKTVQDLKDIINNVFELESQKYFLLDLQKKIVDNYMKLSDIETDLFFKIKQKYDTDIEIVIKEINSNFEKDKVLNQHNILLNKIPSKEKVIELIEQKVNKKIKDLILYKSNTLQEPCKRVNQNKFSFKQFEMDSQYIIFVNIDNKPLQFEKMKMNLFISKKYPIENSKILQIYLFNELDLQTALQKIIDYCVEHKAFENDKAENYLFQFLTKEQKAGQYLQFRKTKIKKAFSNNNNILIRQNKNKLVIPERNIVLFFRQRNSEKKIYEEHEEKFIEQKYRRINNKNYLNVDSEFKKLLNIDQEEKVIFLLADYKQYQWKRIDQMTGNLKDGDEIGYIKESDLKKDDNLQTDEFLAAKLSQNNNDTIIYLPNAKIQEKSFKINLE